MICIKPCQFRTTIHYTLEDLYNRSLCACCKLTALKSVPAILVCLVVHCAGKEPCFVPLLPPKETTTITSAQALDYQLGYRPAAADVVALSEVTNPRPLHSTPHRPHAWVSADS